MSPLYTITETCTYTVNADNEAEALEAHVNGDSNFSACTDRSVHE